MHNKIRIRQIKIGTQKRVRVEYFATNYGKVKEHRVDFYVPEVSPLVEERTRTTRGRSPSLIVLKEKRIGQNREGPMIQEELYFNRVDLTNQKEACHAEAYVAGAYEQARNYARNVASTLGGRPLQDDTGLAQTLQTIIPESRLHTKRPRNPAQNPYLFKSA